MPHAHAETTINRPIEEVFSYVSTPQNESHWMPGASKISNVTDGPTHLGTTYDSLVHFLGRNMDFKVEVTEYDTPRAYGYRARHGRIESHRHVRFEPVEDGVMRITMDLEAEGHHHMLRMAEEVLIRAGQRHDQHGLENLRDILETHGPDHPRHDD